MANETQVKQLLELAEDCTKTPVDQLITNADWGTINFGGSRAELDRTFDMLNQFKLLPARLLPDNMIQQIISTLQPLTATLDQIRSFSIEQGNPPGGRDTLVAQFRGQADAFFGLAIYRDPMTTPCLEESSILSRGPSGQADGCLNKPPDQGLLSDQFPAIRVE